MSAKGAGGGLLERIAGRIPDPVIIFLAFYVVAFVVSVALGGTAFSAPGGSGESFEIRSMATAENVRWIFSNCLVRNWVSYAHGMLPIVLVVMMGIGVAEKSGFFSVLLRLVGRGVNGGALSYAVVGAGMAASVASDAAYLVLIPLAATLYATMGRSPLVGIATAFAGVSAGFGANLIPATTHDVVVGVNAIAFAEGMGVPAVSRCGAALCAPTMDYFYMAGLFVVFTAFGGFVTNRFVAPRVSKIEWTAPDGFRPGEFAVTGSEMRSMWWGVAGFLVAIAVAAAFAFGPLAPYVDATGRRHQPFMENVVVFVALAFLVAGLACGIASGKIRSARDAISAAAGQMGSCGYLMVLTFVAFNFLAMFNYSGLGAWIACSGAKGLLALDLGASPSVVLVAFILFTAFVNLFISSLSAKWMLIGPVFVPMLYHVNNALTPEVVAAAYRTGDPCTNILTPVMTFAGVVLVFCRKWKPDFTIGDQILMMFPYSAAFLSAAVLYMLVYFNSGLPFGF